MLFSRSQGDIPKTEGHEAELEKFLNELHEILKEKITPFIGKLIGPVGGAADATQQKMITVNFIAWELGGIVSKSLAQHLAQTYESVFVGVVAGNVSFYTFNRKSCEDSYSLSLLQHSNQLSC